MNIIIQIQRVNLNYIGKARSGKLRSNSNSVYFNSSNGSKKFEFKYRATLVLINGHLAR